MSKTDSMVKAYDVGVLVEDLKEVGVSEGIDTLKKGLDVLEKWAEKSAALSTEGLVGKLDDVAVKGEKFAIEFLKSKLDELQVKLLADAPAPAPVAESIEVPASTEEAPKA